MQGSLPVRKDDLALWTLLLGLNTLRVIQGQGTDVGCQPRQVLGLHPTEGHDRAGNGLLIRGRDVGAGEDNIGEDHPGVRREGADLGDLIAGDSRLDPVGSYDGDHHGLGFGVLVEIDGIRDDVRGLRDPHLAFAIGLKNFGAMASDNLGELHAHVRDNLQGHCLARRLPVRSLYSTRTCSGRRQSGTSRASLASLVGPPS